MDFTIRNLPAPVIDDLERAARLNGRTLNDEAIARLTGAAGASGDFPAREVDRVREPGSRSWSSPPVSTAELAEQFRLLREQDDLPSLTPELLDELKREGRL